MNADELIVYVPNARQKVGLIKTWVLMWHNIIRSKELITVLFKRDFLNAYRKSFLGIGWILVSPIVGIVSWVFLNSTGVLQPGDIGIPFPAYVLLSSSIWGLFMGFFTSASSTLGSGTEFIMQVKYPHEALLLKQVAVHLANFTITFGINIIVLLFFGVVPSWHIIFFPILILPLFFLGSAIGLVISVVSVVASDISNAFNILFGFVFYITPIIYSPDTESKLLQTIIEINPLTHLIGGVRDSIIYGSIDNIGKFIFYSIISLVLFLLSLRLFYISEDRVVERMI